MKWAWRGALFGGGLLLAIVLRESGGWRAVERAAGWMADQIETVDQERDHRLGKTIAAEMKQES